MTGPHSAPILRGKFPAIHFPRFEACRSSVRAPVALSCLLFSMNPSIFGAGSARQPSGAGEDADREIRRARRWFMQAAWPPKGKTPANCAGALSAEDPNACRADCGGHGGGGDRSLCPTCSRSGWDSMGALVPHLSYRPRFRPRLWLSSRGERTSVVIDTADPTGNTVYLGGAYGGVWRSKCW